MMHSQSDILDLCKEDKRLALSGFVKAIAKINSWPNLQECTTLHPQVNKNSAQNQHVTTIVQANKPKLLREKKRLQVKENTLEPTAVEGNIKPEAIVVEEVVHSLTSQINELAISGDNSVATPTNNFAEGSESFGQKNLSIEREGSTYKRHRRKLQSNI